MNKTPQSEHSVLQNNKSNELNMKSMDTIKGGFWPGFPATVPSRRQRYDMILGNDVEGISGLQLRSIYMSDLPELYRRELAREMTA